MNLLKQSTINELVKLLARKKTSFFLLLSALLPFIGLPIVMKLQSGLGIMAVSNVQYPITVLNILTLFVLPLMMFMSLSDMFSGEFGDKTIRSVLVRPVSRLKIFSSKLLAMFVLITGQLLLGWMGSVLATFFLPASANLMGGIAEAALAYAVAALPMFALCMAAAFITQFFRNASGALAICIVLYAAAKLITFVYPQFTVLSPTSYTDWHELWIGSVISTAKITTIFSLLLGCGILFYTSGYYFFDKKEV
jgi:ABC-2 type transport system permease protein